MPVRPSRIQWSRRILLILIALGTFAALAGALAPAAMRARADNPIWRGQRLAARHGCFDCHRAPLRQDLANHGSRFGSVPGFDGGELMMYVESAEETAEWIRDGSTARLRADADAWAAYEAQLIRMPAFGTRLRAEEIADLARFVIASNAFHSPPDETARHGEEIARTHCLSCHNVGGAGGLPNRGSAFGYVPGWWGPDFDDLVLDRAAIREWIRTGSSARVGGWPLAAHFLRRQAIQMPAFEDVLSDEEIEATIAYVEWLGRTDGGVRP